MSEKNQILEYLKVFPQWIEHFVLYVNKFAETVEKLENIINRLEQIKESECSNPHLVSLSSEQEDTFVVTKPVEVSEPQKEECFYFLGVAKGTFSKPSTEPEEYSLYRFVKITADKAQVFVENTPNAVRSFRNDPDAQETACESENQCPNNPKGITTVDPGEAVFDGTKWTITTKVKIRYV